MRKEVIFRNFAGFFAFIMVMAFGYTISNADVAWEPDNNFYLKHAEECMAVRERDLLANGPGGKVTVWESPESAREVGTIENGSRVSLEYVYTDKRGYTWGIVYNRGNEGWVPRDYLVKDPGLSNFIEKHKDEYQQYNDRFTVPEGVERVYFWRYPGSGEIVGFTGADSSDWMDVTSSYTDREGRQWGYVVYYRGLSGWICMSDPANDQIPVDEEDAAGVVMPPEPTEIIMPQPEGANIVLLVVILVAAVSIGTVILIRVVFTKKAAKAESDDDSGMKQTK